MKDTKLRHRKMVLLAVASAALLLTPVVRAVGQTLTPQFDDLILGFRATGDPGSSLNLEVDLGNMSNFYDLAVGTVIPVPALAVQDLVDVYGADWSTRTDLVWGAVATTGRASGTPDGHAPVDTLWATRAAGLPSWARGSSSAQANASAIIEPMLEGGSAGTLYGATPTTNSAAAAVIDATQPGSWSKQESKTAGESFGRFNPTIDNTANIPDGGEVVSILDESAPGSGASSQIGELILTQDGLSYEAIPEPSAAILVALGLGCSVVILRRRKAARA